MISLIAGKILTGALAKALKGGDAWKEKGWGGQQAVVDHAKKLGYPGNIAPAGSDKKTWTSFTKAFNAWKASGMPGKKTSKPATPTKTSSKKKKSKTKPAPAPVATPEAGSDPGLGPYPERNVFFPMLAQEYTAPSAMDLSAYLPADAYGDGMLTGGAPARYDQAVFPGKYDDAGNLVMTKDVGKPDYSDVRGLLYQPFTTEYQQAFVPANLWNYQPVQFDITPVQYTANPYAKSASKLAAEAKALEAAEMAAMRDYGYYGDYDGNYNYGNGPTYVVQALTGGGKSEGDRGYGASLPAYGYANMGEFVADMADRIAGGQGLTAGEGAGWGGAEAGAGVGVSGGSGKGPAAGGMGKGY